MTIGKERGSFEFAITSYTAERNGIVHANIDGRAAGFDAFEALEVLTPSSAMKQTLDRDFLLHLFQTSVLRCSLLRREN